MRIYSDKVFNTVADKVCGHFYEADKISEDARCVSTGDLNGSLVIQRGNDECGYWSFCEGYIDVELPFNPVDHFVQLHGLRNLRLEGKGHRIVTSKEQAVRCQRLINRCANEGRILANLWEDHKWSSFASRRDFFMWYENDFEDLEDHEVSHDEIDEAIRNYWSECTPFIRMRVRFDQILEITHKPGYTRTVSKGIKVTVSSSYNDDYNYGRTYSDHDIYCEVIDFPDTETMLAEIDKYITRALYCIGIECECKPITVKSVTMISSPSEKAIRLLPASMQGAIEDAWDKTPQTIRVAA